MKPSAEEIAKFNGELNKGFQTHLAQGRTPGS